MSTLRTCDCACRHLLRDIVCSAEAFPHLQPPAARAAVHGESYFEIGRPSDAYFTRVVYDDVRPRGASPLVRLYSHVGAAHLFAELQRCRCCARHCQGRPRAMPYALLAAAVAPGAAADAAAAARASAAMAQASVVAAEYADAGWAPSLRSGTGRLRV